MSTETHAEKARRHYRDPVSRERILKTNRRYHARNRKKITHARWVRALRAKFGLSEAQYWSMFSSQHGRCASCGVLPFKERLSVDHNHQTGEIRKLLCKPCNRGIGVFHEDPVRLRAAAAYCESVNA